MTRTLLGMALVLVTLGVLLGGLTLYRRLGAPHPEWLRKILHVGMGSLTLIFPWLFDESWPVVVLASLSVLLLLGMRLVSVLKASVGQVVGGVSRFSLGEIYFPVAVTILWVLYVEGRPEPAGRRLLLYLIPVLLLTISDALAALVGLGYGGHKYVTSDGTKSHEGSIAFFLSALLCVHVPLLLIGDLGRPETLLIALLLALLATMFEAIAWAGLDNLVLPLVSHLLLVIYWDEPASRLLERVGMTALLAVVALGFSWRTTLVGNALHGVILVGYICWALGGWAWVVPPLILFISYTFLSPRNEENSKKIHNIHAVVSTCGAGMIWLFLSRLLDRPEWFFSFTVAFAAQLVAVGIAQMRYERPSMSATAVLSLSILKGWVLIMLPYVLLECWAGRSFLEVALEVALALGAIAVAACGFHFTQPTECRTDTPRWLRQAVWPGVASLLAAIPSLFPR
jgi:phytol kinase